MAKNPRLIDLSGKRFGRWLACEQSGNDDRGGALWLAVCDCGTERIVIGADLRSGKSASCGCYKNEVTGARRRTHGSSETRLHSIWKGMRGRCNRPTNPKFYAYGARGIRLCAEWDDFACFQSWSLSAGYAAGLTIERIDVDRNYEPSNCTWIPADQQSLNRRNSRRAPDGELWLHKARRAGIKDAAFRRRVFDGWDLKEAATVPMGERRIERPRDAGGRYR